MLAKIGKWMFGDPPNNIVLVQVDQLQLYDRMRGRVIWSLRPPQKGDKAIACYMEDEKVKTREVKNFLVEKDVLLLVEVVTHDPQTGDQIIFIK